MPTKIEKDTVTGQDTTGHEWDGLKELNTPLPKWWLYTFYASIGVAGIYFILYPAIPSLTGYTGGLLGDSGQQRLILERQMEAASERHADQRAGLEQAEPHQILDDPTLLAVALRGGEAAFGHNCVQCHGLGGSGQEGGYPVLADDEWIWGGTVDEIRHTIAFGVRHEPRETRFSEMPAFGELELLVDEEIDAVTAYVMANAAEPVELGTAEMRAEGEQIYLDWCADCHGAEGHGITEFGAPSLRDHIWLYGGSPEEVRAQIHNPILGVMPAFGPRLDEATIKMLTVYVHELGGGQTE